MRAGNYEANLFSSGIKIKSGWFQKKFKLKNLISDQKNIFKTDISNQKSVEKIISKIVKLEKKFATGGGLRG